MNKVFGVLTLAIMLCAVLLGCSGSATTISPAWADYEELTYTVKSSVTDEMVGSMTVKNTRKPDNKTIGDATYGEADGRTEITVSVGDVTKSLVVLTKQYTVLAEEKTVTRDGETTVYTVRHSGSNAYYSVNGEKEKKLKAGGSGYTDSEYLYNYIRCYTLESTAPSSIKIADYETGTVKTVSCSLSALNVLSVPYPDGTKSVECTVVAITLSDTPQGAPIYAWYTPDSDGYRVTGLSRSPSKKFPAKIAENDLVYTLTSIYVK